MKAALALAGGASLEDVSMRALARKLRVPVMTLYNYVPSKDALYEVVSDHLLRPVRVPPPEEGTWDERIRRLERAARRAMGRHPGLFSLSHRGSGGAEAARLAQGVLSILASGGFAPDDAALAFATLYTFMLGQLDVDAIAAALGGRTEKTFEAATKSTRLSPDALFERGFDAVIEGLKAKLIRRRPRRPRPFRRGAGSP